MTAIAHGTATDMTQQTTTSSTFQDLVSEPSTSFVATGKYLLTVSASFGGSDVNALFEVQCRHASTVFPGSLAILEPRDSIATRKHGYHFSTVFTQPATAESIDVQFRSQNGTATARVEDITLSWIRLDADLTENTDWFFAEDDDEASPVTLTTSFVAFASTTFTPDNNNDDWLVIGCIRVHTNNNSKNYGFRASAGGPRADYEGEDLAGRDVKFVSRVSTLADSSQTISVEALQESDAGTDHEHMFSSIFVLRLNAFEEHHFEWLTANLADETTYTEIAGGANLAFTPTTAGDFWILGSGIWYRGSGNNTHTGIRIQSSGTTIPAGFNESNFRCNANDADDRLAFNHQVIVNLAASAQDIDVDAKAAGTVDGDWAQRLAVAFSMELVAAAAAQVLKRPDLQPFLAR